MRAHYSGTSHDLLLRAQFENQKSQHSDLLRVGSWADWEQKPAFLTFKLSAKILADPGTAFTLKIGNLTYTGVGTTDPVATPWMDVTVRLNERIPVSFFGPAIRGITNEWTAPYYMDVRAAPFLDPKDGVVGPLEMSDNPALNGYIPQIQGFPLNPIRYPVYWEGQETYGFSCGIPAGVTSTNWTMQVQMDEQTKKRKPVECSQDVPELQSPGEAGWPAIAPGKSHDPASEPIKWSVSLGRLYNGVAAGRLYYLVQGLSSNAFTPAALLFDQPFTNNTQVTLIQTNNLLRQIRAPQAVVDIPHDRTNSLELRFYLTNQVAGELDTNGLYAILDDAPFVVWRFTNTSPATNIYTKWRLTEERPGWPTYTNEVEYVVTNQAWLLTRGTGVEQYRETRALCLATNIDVVLDEDENPIATNYIHFRYETNQLSDGAGHQAFIVVENYVKTNDWFWCLNSVVIGPPNWGLTYSFEYCPYGVSRINYPDASWEEREYSLAVPTDGWSPIMLKQIRRSKTATLTNIIDYTYSSSPLWHVHKMDFSMNEQKYRWDYLFIDTAWPKTNAVRQIYERGGLECAGGAIRHQEMLIRYIPDVSEECLGQTMMWRSNYMASATNTLEWGSLADGVFTQGDGRDWRKTTDYGPGNPDDSEGWLDTVLMIPGQSARECEIRQGGVVTRREFYIFYTDDLYYTEDTFEPVFSDLYSNDCLGRPTGVTRLDANSLATRTLRTVDWQGAHSIPGTLLLSEADEYGLTRSYTYDSLKRLKTVTLAGAGGLPDLTVSYTYDARDQVLTISTNAGSLTLVNAYAYDVAGRRTRETNHLGLVTTYSYTVASRSLGVTYPGGAYLWHLFDLSGELCGQSGNAALNTFSGTEYSTVEWLLPQGESINYYKNLCAYVRYQTNGGPGSLRWQATCFNMWDKPVAEIQPGWGDYPIMTNRSYTYLSSLCDDNVARAESPVTQTNISTFYNYDLENNLTAEMVGVHNYAYSSNLLAYHANSSNRLTTITNRFVRDASGAWFRYASKSNYLVDSDPTPTLVSEARERLNGLAANVKGETVTLDADANEVTQTVYVDRSNKTVTTVAVDPLSTLAASNVVVNGLLVSESTVSVAAPTTYGYDGLRRQTQAASPEGATTRTAYNALGQVAGTTDFAGNTTTFEYYPGSHLNAGRLKCATGPTGKKTYYEYNARGQTVHTWGDVPYPEERVYNDYGELAELHTYRGGSGWTGSIWPTNSTGTASVTTWDYDPATGLLLAKTNHAAGGGTFFVYSYYDRSHMLYARGAYERSVSYSYTDQGELASKGYGDGSAPPVYYRDFNRAGQPRTIIDASGARSLVYDHAGRVVLECWTDGAFAGLALSNHIDRVKGRDSLDLLGAATTLHHGFGYDDYGRLNSVTAGTASATYAYLPNSDRLQTTAFKSGLTTNLLTTRVWELGERLQRISHTVGNASVPFSALQYWYDPLQRRTQALLEDGSRWQYGYNNRDELAAGRRYWGDGAPVSGQQFGYSFDTIGNRTNAAAGGDATGANLRRTDYVADEYNGLAQVTTSGYKDVLGLAYTTNNVWVNGSTNGVDRHSEYFHKELSVNNSAGPVWTMVTVTNQAGTNAGGFILPKAQQGYAYDLDGYLSIDSVCSYTWDGENRLISLTMTNVGSLPNTQRKQITFAYDEQGRRMAKVVRTWNSVSNAFVNPVTNLFVYDGWRVIAILNPQSAILQSFAWGPDLSGSLEGAGGTGGLLVFTEHGSGANRTNHFYAHDGNGNVLALVNATNGTISARYEYGPFGEPLRATGPAAKANPFRWGTKYADEETGLVYYGYRFYNPTLGRWLNRDPKEEEGGINLYAFCENDPINVFDALGMEGTLLEEESAAGIAGGVEANGGGAQAITFANKVRDAVDTFSDFQQFIGDVMDSAEGDSDDLFINLLSDSNSLLSSGLKVTHAFERHHPFSREFADHWESGKINWNKLTKTLTYRFHRGLHSGRGKGGAWNTELRKYFGDTEPGKKTADALKGKVMSMMKKYGIDKLPWD